MTDPLRLLVLEDNPSDAELIVQELTGAGFELDWKLVETESDFLDALGPSIDLVLADYALPGYDGLTALSEMRERGLDIPFIIVSGTSGEELAVSALKRGAADYLVKDRLTRLGPAVFEALENREMRNRAAAAALRESEEEFRSTFEQAGIGIAHVAPDGHWLRVNQKLCDIVGYSREELLQKSFLDLTLPGEVELDAAAMRRLLANEIQAYSREKQYLGKDDLLVWVDITVSLVRSAAGEPEYFVSITEDISARKQAEDELRRSVAYNRSLFEANLDMVATVGLDGRVTDMNAATEKASGFSREEVLGTDFADYFTDPESARQGAERVFRDGFVNGYPLEMKRRDGGIVSVLVNSSVLRDESGEVIGVIAASRDVSEARRMEEALREREANLNEAQRVGAFGSWEWNATTDTISWSENFCRIYGFDPNQAAPVYEEHLKAYTDESGARLRVAVDRAMQIGEPFELDLELVTAGDSKTWVTARGEVMRDASGQIIGLRGTCHDVSERRRAEEALRANEDRHRAILRTAMSGFLLLDTQGRLLEVNESYCRMSGYSEQELLTMDIRDLTVPEISGDTGARIRKVMAQGEDRFESRHRRKDGSSYDVEVNIQYRPVEGGQIVGFLQDITERKRLEAELRQTQKMESVGQLAGGIAHDFNNLLNVINGTAFLVSEQLRPGDPLQEDLREITRASDRAAAMTRQLLAFSRKQVMQLKILDLNTLLRDMEGMLSRLIGEDVDLTLAEAKGPCAVKADPGQIEQVVLNLAINARDAMPTGGTLAIATEAVHFDEPYARAIPPLLPGPYAALTIRDTGMGMDQATLAQIFEPFFTTKEVGKGTGLGLSTVFGIVSQSAGGIEVVSGVGKGTTFKVYLPRFEEAATKERHAPPVAADRGAETILVVEDYGGLRQLAKRLLEKAGYTVLLASHGGEALKLLENHDGPVHLLLTDVVMPEMNGPELAERVVQDHPEIKVIYTSGYPADALTRHGVDAAADHLLTKPYTHETLTRAVRTALDMPAEKLR